MNAKPYVVGSVGYLPVRRPGGTTAWAKLDAERLSWASQWSWYLSPQGYVVRGVRDSERRYTSILLHRVIVGLPPYGVPKVKFVNHDKLDLRLSNLAISQSWAAKALKDDSELQRLVRSRAVALATRPIDKAVA